VLLLDKPVGLSSNAALQAVKRLYRAAKAGHAGTLDPLASGMLPVLFGDATKFAQLLLDADKEYSATIKLGETTSTGDAEGKVLARKPVQVDDRSIEEALERFRGSIEQTPPMHSALKRQGKPLYLLARQGREVERRPRRVQIQELELLERRGERLEVRVRCSKGTYVRTLAQDIGEVLGTGAHLAALRRRAAGGFDLAEAKTLNALQEMNEAERDACLIPVEQLLKSLPRIELPPEAERRFRNGQTIAQFGLEPGICAVFRVGNGLIGLGELGPAGLLRPLRLTAISAQAAE
jgi:tRNA pseudouridine55 synthase